MDLVERGVVEGAEQGRAPHLALGTHLGLWMAGVLTVQRNDLGAPHHLGPLAMACAGLTMGQPRRAHSLMPPLTYCTWW